MTAGGRQLGELAQAITIPVSHDGREGEVFATLPVPGSQCHLLGRDAQGFVALLLALDTSFPLGPFPPVRLENLGVLHAARCTVTRQGESQATGVFSVVRCLSNDPALIDLFVEVMAPVAEQFTQPAAAQKAVEVIDRIIRLFRDLGRPSERAVQGLWAEMFVIAMARDPVVLSRAWRTATFDMADFATARERLEVKSTTGPVRSHAFNAEQLRVPEGAIGVVASVICQRSAGGVSLGDLWSVVRRHVAADPNLLLSVDGIVAATLGCTWKQALPVRYDWHVARDTLQFFAMKDIPAVGVELSPDVSEVRFRSNLNRCTPLDARALTEMGPLFAAVSNQFSNVGVLGESAREAPTPPGSGAHLDDS